MSNVFSTFTLIIKNNNMKSIVSLFILMLVVSICTSSCSSNKHKCRGLKAHPNYSKKWGK